jgi:hypothetical protein
LQCLSISQTHLEQNLKDSSFSSKVYKYKEFPEDFTNFQTDENGNQYNPWDTLIVTSRPLRTAPHLIQFKEDKKKYSYAIFAIGHKDIPTYQLRTIAKDQYEEAFDEILEEMQSSNNRPTEREVLEKMKHQFPYKVLQ